MKILVTGSSGFVGQNLVSFLKNSTDYEVKEISLRNGVPLDFPSAHVVIHLAGKAHDLRKTSQEKEYYDVNFELTKEVFGRFLKDPFSQIFIFMSSVKASKDVVVGYLTEETKCEPMTPYGKSKLFAEQFIIENIGGDKKYFILRPCMIHGPNNKGNLNALYRLVTKKLPWPLGAFDNKRSFCSIDNLLFVIDELIKSGNIPSGIYNVADDEALSTNEVINLISRVLGVKTKLLKISPKIISFMARIGDRLKMPMNSENLQKLTQSYVVSNRKVKNLIGKPLPYSSEKGMIKTIQSFKKN